MHGCHRRAVSSLEEAIQLPVPVPWTQAILWASGEGSEGLGSSGRGCGFAPPLLLRAAWSALRLPARCSLRVRFCHERPCLEEFSSPTSRRHVRALVVPPSPVCMPSKTLSFCSRPCCKAWGKPQWPGQTREAGRRVTSSNLHLLGCGLFLHMEQGLGLRAACWPARSHTAC